MPGNSTGQENLKGKKSYWGNVDKIIEDNCTEGNFILVYHKFTPYDYHDNALYLQHLGFAKNRMLPSAAGLPFLQFPGLPYPVVVFLIVVVMLAGGLVH